MSEEDVLARSDCVLREESYAKRRAVRPAERGQPWWTSAAVDMTEGLQHRKKTSLRLDMRPSISEDRQVAMPVCEDLAHTAEAPDPATEVNSIVDAPQTPIEITQELAKHYLETLYLSRTSLAYFTKGPLSRARATFAAKAGATATNELVSFLRECILTSSTMDKKCKDGIPSIVKDFAVDPVASPEQPKKTKRRRKWKSKRDKFGFFVDEKDIVESWWLDHDDVGSFLHTAETVDEALQRRLPKLRSRETFLQLILVLETLALEASLPFMAAQNLDTQPRAVESYAVESQSETQDVSGEKNRKPKKKQDLPSLLETLLDKLCIWHSLESHSPTKKGAGEDDENERDNDALKIFCIEVVIPFYVSRIPQHAATVNKKFGGPSAPSPAQHKSAPVRRPGEPAVRQVPEKKPGKPLSRVGTDTLNRHPRAAPSLTRSATDSEALSSFIKRETSEVSLDSIPAVSQHRKLRQSLMHTLDSSRRQVDLNAMSQANDAKMQKKAEMQEKMQSAINMLRKPNRAAALAEIREQTDDSFAKAVAGKGRLGGCAQKAKASTRSQITATPGGRRTVAATPFKRIAVSQPTERMASSGTSHVPSSSVRLPQPRDAVPSSIFAVPQTGHRPRHAAPTDVEETPSRGFAKFMPVGLARELGTLDSPTISRKVQATPSKPVRSLSLGVSGTRIDHALVAASPNVQRRDEELSTQTMASKSVYDSLGWDEDEYEDLA